MRRDLARGQRDEVRVAVHEAHVPAIRDHLDDVAAQQRPSALGPRRPVQHGAAGEVPAAADELQPLAERLALAAPQLDRRVGAHDPLRVVGVQVDRAVEPSGPVHHGRVVVGMRDGDPGQPAAAPRPPARSPSSSSVMQSQRSCRSPNGTSSPRCPIANRGSVPIPISSSSGAMRLAWSERSSSRVVHRWPSASGTYWRHRCRSGSAPAARRSPRTARRRRRR